MKLTKISILFLILTLPLMSCIDEPVQLLTSREIISEIAKTKPNHVRFGDERTLDEVLNKPYNLTKEDLLNLRTKSEETRHAIANIEEEIKTYNRTR